MWTLVDNAIKYLPSGGRISVSVEKTGRQARLEVRDTGMGIPEAMLPRVFERFFRADPSRAEVEGTGLEPAIAKWIADVHHAAIAVDSIGGRGTTVQVLFPSAC